MESLLLFRRALPSPTMCRFIPALSVPLSARFPPAFRLVPLSACPAFRLSRFPPPLSAGTSTWPTDCPSHPRAQGRGYTGILAVEFAAIGKLSKLSPY
jgi:hypothetical protein